VSTNAQATALNVAPPCVLMTSLLRAAPVALLALALALAGCAAKDTLLSPTSAGGPSATPTASGAAPAASSSTSASPSGSPSSSPSPSPSGAPRPAKTFEVDIKGDTFVGGTLTVQKGDTVHWVHMDGTTPHSVVSDDGKFSSDTQGLPCPGPGCMNSAAHNTFDVTFAEAGSYPYHCEVHANMRNTITVVAALPP
jgi:plastocyanin